MLSFPRPPSPRYYFIKVREVSVKGGGGVRLGNYTAAARRCREAQVSLGQSLQLKSALSAGCGCSRWCRWAPTRTHVTAGCKRGHAAGGQDRGGGQNRLGGCAGGSPALPSHISSPSCHPALHGRRHWLPSLSDFCFSTMQKRQRTAPELRSLRLRLPRAGRGRRGEERRRAGKGCALLSLPKEGDGGDQGPCLWQGDRVAPHHAMGTGKC